MIPFKVWHGDAGLGMARRGVARQGKGVILLLKKDYTENDTSKM